MKRSGAIAFGSAEAFKHALDKGEVLEGVRKELVGGVAKQESDGLLAFTLSTEAVDRSRDVVMQGGWQLDAYRKNPIVLWAHDYGMPPVARAPQVAVEDGKLKARGVEFQSRDVSPFGWSVGEMYRRGFLHAVSVGFRPLKWNWNEDRKSGIDFHEQELLEWSAVPVPANPEALIGAKAAGIPLEPLVEWAEKVLDAAPSESGRLLVPREYVERMYAVARGGRLVTVGEALPERAQQLAEDAEGDMLVGTLERLIDALERNTQAVEKAQPQAVAAPPQPTKAPQLNPQELARAVGEEIRRQVAAVIGRV